MAYLVIENREHLMDQALHGDYEIKTIITTTNTLTDTISA